MRLRRLLLALGSGASLIGAIVPASQAAPVTAPTSIQWSSSPSSLTTTYTTVRDPRDSSIFNGQTLARDVNPGGEVVAPWNGVQEFTSGVVTRSASSVGTASTAQVAVYGDAGSFDARLQAAVTSSAGYDAFAGARAGVGHWYVVSGVGSGPVSLRVDVMFQGQLMASPCQQLGCEATAYFTHLLGVIASPDDLVQETPLLLNGGALAGTPVFGNPGTVPDVVFAADGLVHDVNLIVRSNPFLVTPGVPFRLNLSLNASAGSLGPDPSAAFVDFYDPTLATSLLVGTPGLSPTGFVIDLDGDAGTQDVRMLEVGQLANANVPVPPTFALILLGVVGLVRAGRRMR
jgi:hypothetical protein